MNQLRKPISILLCISLLCIHQKASAQLNANFSASPLSGCAPLVVNFTDLSTGGPTSWQWDLGNGTMSTLQNPTGSYFNAGTYSVKLVIQNGAGSDSITRNQYITVFPKPVVAFMASDTVGCLPRTIQFTDQSTTAGGTITSWLWDFGDGSTSTVQNPSHVFSTAGNFTVSLQVVNNDGCITVLTKPTYINIANGPTADFSNPIPSVCSINPSILFTNLSTGPGPLTYQWQFGDGGTSTQTNPSHTYTVPGSYTVRLIAISPFGCSDTIIKPQLINYGVIQSQFTYPLAACVGSAITVTNTTTPAPLISNWNFGDGTTATGLSPTKIYAAPGTYTIRLINDFGACRDTITHSITVNPKPTTNFVADITSSCQAPLTVTFNATTTGTIYSWNFGDGDSSALEDPVHIYTAPGTYSVRLIVSNASGCSDTLTRTNYISIAPPTISIAGLPRTGCVPITILPIPTITSTEPITTYLWNFGDGGTSSLALPTHIYAIPGTYTVSLTITTASGCTTTLSIPNAVRAGAKPAANFTVNPSDVCAEDPVQFTNTSIPSTDQWQWDFGDGGTSGLENPTHIYSDTGYFNVTLIVWNNTCPDTIVYNNIVHIRPPIARFTVIDSCARKFTKRFVDNSIGALSWAWDFGDGTSSTLQNPIHTYAVSGTYTVVLIATNGPCSFTYSQDVNVVNELATINADQNIICRNTSVKLTAPSVSAANITNWEWNFGDGSPVSNSPDSTSHIYTSSGIFRAVLVITDMNGCIDSAFTTITVYGPTANFSAPPSICLGNSAASFNDLSTTDGLHPLVQWEWQYGDGASVTYTAPPFQHLYTARGSYDVSLRITDQYGCVDSITRINAIIVSKPIAGFDSPDTVTCTNRPVNFNNASQGTGNNYLWHFGDGTTSTQTNPVHSYTSTGIFTVQLDVIDQYGCTDTLIRTDYINISLPVAGFLVSDTFSSCPPLQVTFTSQATGSLNVSWDFGDGNTSLITDPIHNYTIAGVYFAKQYVTGPGGCIDSISRRIEIRGPSGIFNYSPDNGCAPVSVTFTATAQNHSSILWDFTDGSTATTTGSSITHIYNAQGDYLPRMILIDSGGCTVPVLGVDTIHVSGIDANFSMDISTSCDAATVTFTNQTITNGTNASWLWNFGDGTTSTVQNPQHIYTVPGFYPVKLRAMITEGCIDSLVHSDTIRIHARPLISINGPDSACIPATVQMEGIVNSGNPSLISWNWNMGNGRTDSMQAPSNQTYTTARSYTIRAIATNEFGCRDTARKIFRADPLPNTNAGTDKIICQGTPVQLIATGAGSYTWEPAPVISCTACSSPLVNPPDNTLYVVNGFNIFGCNRRDSVLVRVRKPFQLVHTLADTLCLGERSQLSASGADFYAWSPASTLNNSTISNPLASPVTTTVYRVIGRDSSNCFRDTADITVRVYPIPVVNAGVDQTVSAGSSVQLNGTASSDVTKYLWIPAFAISCPTCKDPVVTPVRTTDYKLEVKNDGGCISSDFLTVFVTCNNGNLFIPNTFSPNGNGMNEYFYPRGKGIAKIKSFRVFNRWGELVFEKMNFMPNDAAFGWDGTYKGSKLGADVFIYTCDVVCENNTVLSYKGDITLLR